MLVGTASIDVSEEISKLLTEKGIRHQVLNAKNHESEAEIVSHAGEKGAVTIATNMAGRGTDIKLGEGVTELGGLKIIGTERHESMRIDNQLRGRAGRQGDPGESKFYLSLEDDLMRLFGYDKFKKIYEVYKIPEGEDIQDKSVAKQIRRAQKDKENNNFGIRKNLLDYDAVNNQQREIIYAERRRVLNGESMRDLIYDMIRKVVEDDVLEATGGSIKCMDVDTFDTVLNRLREDVPIGQVTVSGEELNDAITLALYAKLPRGSKNFININETSASVSFRFSITTTETKEYLVERSFRYPGKDRSSTARNTTARLSLLSDVDTEILADKPTDVTRSCTDLLGLSSDDFLRTVVLPQGQFSDFLKLKNQERRGMLQRIFHLERYGIELTRKVAAARQRMDIEVSSSEGQLQAYDDISYVISGFSGSVPQAFSNSFSNRFKFSFLIDSPAAPSCPPYPINISFGIESNTFFKCIPGIERPDPFNCPDLVRVKAITGT